MRCQKLSFVYEWTTDGLSGDKKAPKKIPESLNGQNILVKWTIRYGLVEPGLGNRVCKCRIDAEICDLIVGLKWGKIQTAAARDLDQSASSFCTGTISPVKTEDAGGGGGGGEN